MHRQIRIPTGQKSFINRLNELQKGMNIYERKDVKFRDWTRSSDMSGLFFISCPPSSPQFLCASSSQPNKEIQNQLWLTNLFLPPPRRLPSWRSDCGPCKASGCPSHAPSATMRGWLPTSLTRTAAGTGKPVGGEQDQRKRLEIRIAGGEAKKCRGGKMLQAEQSSFGLASTSRPHALCARPLCF